MLSVDGRLIVRRVAVRAGGRKRRYRYNSSSCEKHFSHSITENTLCYTQLKKHGNRQNEFLTSEKSSSQR
ncbi:hypothetical protein E3U43_000601 [Larimichthys crocea]|uniref:Uncharacterized protein n=1 Tax=Larimichthys crocea TaxID=215358 RepID=A0ACD3Q8X2_LARCR|nr:hypothetical protein E3U43_000601 [Larimichthys crocea]